MELMTWKPIAELADMYQQPLWIASPSLIDLDSNPLGIAEGFWQDDIGWMTTKYDMCQDCWDTVALNKEAVTHFLVPSSPWSPDELEKLSDEDHPEVRYSPYATGEEA